MTIRVISSVFAVAIASVGIARADVTARWIIVSPPLAEGVDALPRLATRDAASGVINARLAEIDAAEEANWQPCADLAQSYRERQTEVTFAGPTYLSVLARGTLYCEGMPHPSPFVQALTFDRKTGAQVAWDSLLPSDLVEPPDAPLVDPGQITGTLRLTDVYVAAHGALDDDCRTEISGRAHDFQIWMVAGGVVLQPSDLAHAVLACADPVTLSGPHLDGLGLDGEVLAALRASLP